MSILREAVDSVHHRVFHPYLTRGEAKTDREIAIDRFLNIAQKIQNPVALAVLSRLFTFSDPLLETTCFGLTFNSPLGVGEGIDKNARIFPMLSSLGFGHVEIGSVTAHPYTGNTCRPRIEVDDKQNVIRNEMGFPNEGIDVVGRRIKKTGSKIGLSITVSQESFEKKTVEDDLAEVVKKALVTEADYIIFNSTSPNNKHLKGLLVPEKYMQCLKIISDKKCARELPLAIKFGVDMDESLTHELIEASIENHVDAIMVSNSTSNPDTLNRFFGKGKRGGVSGSALTELALERSQLCYEAIKGQASLIRVGGIMTPEDYWEAISFGGADLVSIVSAFVLKQTSTPNLAYYFNQDLAENVYFYGKEGLSNIKGKNMLYPNLRKFGYGI